MSGIYQSLSLLLIFLIILYLVIYIVCVCERESYFECNVLYAMSENCLWTRKRGVRMILIFHIRLKWSHLLSWLMYTKLLSLPKKCYCVLNARCFWILRQNQCVRLKLTSYCLIFLEFRLNCLYKLLWLCIAYWIRCVDWKIKVVHLFLCFLWISYLWYVIHPVCWGGACLSPICVF